MHDSPRVLIAEDNIPNQKIISIIIKRLGWEYTIVDNGLKAIEACKASEYDVVLMDIDMPEMNGWDATLEIKKYTPGLPVIALTAYSEDTVGEKSIAAGMDYFLTKPYNHKDIEKTILKCLRKSE